MARYSKFITAIVGAVAAGLTAFMPEAQFFTPELQSALIAVLTAAGVFLVPNRT